MQSDDIIWQVINTTHCAFKVSVPEKDQKFCKNAYNLTGLCNQKDCPLANSRYATIREHEGTLYLYTKTIERAHLPAKMWERVALPSNYMKALELIDKELLYWPDYMIHRCKQRVTKITQYLIKMRKMKLSNEPKKIPIKKKLDRREERREAKALRAANIEKAIEKELIERLKSKAYGDAPLNVNEDIWKQVLAAEKSKELGLDENELEDEEEEQELEEEEEWGGREFVSDESEDEFGDLSDLEDMEAAEDFEEGSSEDDDSGDDASEDEDSDESESSKPPAKSSLGKRKGPSQAPRPAPKKPKTRGPRVEVEYEEEREPARKEQMLSW